MRGIMADNDVGGHVNALLECLETPMWKDVWQRLGIDVVTFEMLGLDRRSSDAAVWRTCQLQELILITGNRNSEAPDSLEVTIRTENRLDSLPVITIGEPRRIFSDRAYAEKAAEKLIDYLMFMEQYRGAGRLFVP